MTNIASAYGIKARKRLPTGLIICDSEGQQYYAIPVTRWTTFWLRVWRWLSWPYRFVRGIVWMASDRIAEWRL